MKTTLEVLFNSLKWCVMAKSPLFMTYGCTLSKFLDEK